jgi:hypothetical protein
VSSTVSSWSPPPSFSAVLRRIPRPCSYVRPQFTPSVSLQMLHHPGAKETPRQIALSRAKASADAAVGPQGITSTPPHPRRTLRHGSALTPPAIPPTGLRSCLGYTAPPGGEQVEGRAMFDWHRGGLLSALRGGQTMQVPTLTRQWVDSRGGSVQESLPGMESSSTPAVSPCPRLCVGMAPSVVRGLLENEEDRSPSIPTQVFEL